MLARARSGTAPVKHELPLLVKRVERVVREIGVRVAIRRKTGVGHGVHPFFPCRCLVCPASMTFGPSFRSLYHISIPIFYVSQKAE